MGATPHHEKRRRAARLRAAGLTLAEVGRRMGISRQAVHHLLRAVRQGCHQPFRVRCRACGADINPAGALPRDDRKVLCLACLARHPRAGFAERLKAHRLAAGLSIKELADPAGLPPSQVGGWEHGYWRRPLPQSVARMSRALGVPVEALGGRGDGEGYDNRRQPRAGVGRAK